MTPTLAAIEAAGVVPVVVLDDEADADFIGGVLTEGGLPVAEVTFRTRHAEAGLRTLAARGDVLVGAGTIVTVEQAKRAVDSGAAFLVSPGLDADVVQAAADLGVPVLPGIATASELQAAVRLGVDTVKAFPARLLGGPPFLHALAGPFPQVRFMPSGGITASDVAAYLRLESVFAVGGSWMVDSTLVARRDETELVERVRDTVARVAGARS